MNVEATIDAAPIGYDEVKRKALVDAGEGLMCEFGVATGRYLRDMASMVPHRKFYGFDSWQGLPEAWDQAAPAGSFKCDMPTDMPPNVELVVGLFQDSLIPFLGQHQEPFAFIHFDADLYSSTKYVLQTINPWVHDTLMMFDQIFDQVPGERYRRDHEGRAFQDYLDETGINCALVGRHKRDGAIFRVWK